MISAGTAGLALGEAAGTAVGGPIGGVVVGTVESFLTGGGSARDAQRQARVAWTLQMAKAGSVTAAEIIIAAPSNVAGDEAPFWTAALSQVPSNVLAQARALAPAGWWPDGQPDFYTDTAGPTHTRIVAEANTTTASGLTNQLQMPAGGSVTPSARPSTSSSTSSAWMWYAVGGVLVLALVVFVIRRRK